MLRVNCDQPNRSTAMPIPGDNGNPKEERDKQNRRIDRECMRGGDVVKDVKLNPPAPKEPSIFGKV